MYKTFIFNYGKHKSRLYRYPLFIETESATIWYSVSYTRMCPSSLDSQIISWITALSSKAEMEYKEAQFMVPLLII
jgi:hypothetical protein